MTALQTVATPPLAGIVAGTLVRKRQTSLKTGIPSAKPAPAIGEGSTPEESMAAVAIDRDRRAFVRLFDHFAPKVGSYVRRLGVDAGASDDLVQDVMLTVWRRAGQFDPSKASVSTWIFAIARNRRIDLARRERRPELDRHDPSLVPDVSANADDTVLSNQHGEMLRGAVARLPAEQAQLLKLAYFEDKSQSEIAHQLDLPLGTVKSRIRLAMQKLRDQLSELR